MKTSNDEKQIYKDFLTNLAVAWFSAGIIAPLLTPSLGIFKLTGSFIAVFGCIISLQLAIIFTKK
jgi:hypothetical protein